MTLKPLRALATAVGVFVTALQFAAQGQPLSITTVAGSSARGYLDGPALQAKFAAPTGLAADAVMHVFVADTENHVVRLLTPVIPGTNWTARTIAGLAGTPGDTDGAAAVSRLSRPSAMVSDGGTNVYLIDTGNSQVRRLYPDATGTNWILVTLAGAANGAAGAADGTNGAAQFNGPTGLALDAAGRLDVADQGNHTIRQMTPDATGTNWAVTTVAGSAGTAGNVDGLGSAARFSFPNSVACDAGGNLYVADGGNNTVRLITADGNVSTIAGGQFGFADGLGTNAQFDFPCGVTVDAATNVYAADYYNNTIRRLTQGATGWMVTTVAGNAPIAGRTDGVASFARFQFADNGRSGPIGLAFDASGRLFVADAENNLVRMGTPFEGLLFTALPAGEAAVAGGMATFDAAAVGAAPITYQWLLNGVAIAGATNAELDLAGLQTNAAGSYSVTVSNAAGISNSPSVMLTVVLPLAVTTLEGVGATGSADGFGLEARFNGLGGVAVDPTGRVLVADAANDLIRCVSPVGQVTTLAGTAQIAGDADGAGGAARLNFPYGVAADLAGNAYVADTMNCSIREISTNGVVQTIAGLAGAAGFLDGPAQAARFSQPYGIAVDRSGTVYVADSLNNRIRAIANGYVTTVAGDGLPGSRNGLGTNAEFNVPLALALDRAGNLFVADYGGDTIRKITPEGMVTTIAGLAGFPGYADGTNSGARFNLPSGIATDAAGDVFVADFGNQVIREITMNGSGNWVTTTLAGFPGSAGDSDGASLGARFHGPAGLAADSAGNLYVGDSLNGIVRSISTNGAVTTLAGPARSYGADNGFFPSSRLNGPRGVAMDAARNIFVADTVNNTIREFGPDGLLSVIAGFAGFPGSSDGADSGARFSAPAGVALDAHENLYVADFQNSTIRRLNLNSGTGQWQVTTLAGTAGAPGYMNATGAAAAFNGPCAVAVDASSNIYVADFSNQVVRLVTAAGVVSKYAGTPRQAGYGDGANAFFNGPAGLALDGAGNVYVADSQNDLIRKIAPDGTVSTVAGRYLVAGAADANGTHAEFNQPQGLAVDAAGNIFVADSGNNAIREITPSGNVVTVAALSGMRGSLDGVGGAAQFSNPISVAAGPDGNLYVADTGNNTVRKASAYGGQALVLTSPFGRSAPVGAPVTLTARAAGAAPLQLAWFGPKPLASATNSILTIAAAQPTDAGNYQFVASNALGASTSVVAALQVTQPPVIFAQSGDVFALSNAPATFTVTAYGAAPLSYQWTFNGAVIPEAAGATYTVNHTQAGNAGTYQVVVSNAFGVEAGLPEELIVAAAPQILAGPSNQTAPCGGSLLLTAQAAGTGPLSYQWLVNGAVAPGATHATFLATNLALGETLSYAVTVSNAFGVATSADATVTVGDSSGPVITIIGATATNILAGSAFTDPGATAFDACAGPVAVTTNGSVNTSLPGVYALVYTAGDGQGNATTNTRTVNVAPLSPVLVTQPVSHTNYPGATQVFSVAVTGSSPLSFQWFRNGGKLTEGGHDAGTATSVLTIQPVSAADAGTYAVAVSNNAGFAASFNAVLTVGPAGAPVSLLGFNRDVVVERTATGGDTTPYAQPFDTTYANPTYCFYETGLNASNYYYGNSPTNLGLVSSGAYTSLVDGATLFQFAPYTASNALFLTPNAPTGTLTLAAPTNFNSLSVLAASVGGGGNGSWTVLFADGSTSPALTLNASNWLNITGGAVTHFGELYSGNYGIFYAYNLQNNYPSLFQTTINLADLGLNLRDVAGVQFTLPASTVATGIFAVSGVTGPALPPLQLSQFAVAGGSLVFSLETVSGETYTLQQTTSLAPGSWQIYSNFTGNGALFSFSVPLSGQRQFFRVIEP